ncbi:MAG: hypothetical protein WCR66_13850, partial [Bacteroidota bacterium]
MPIVEMPNGDHVDFPDDMPKEQIKSMIAVKFPELAKQATSTTEALPGSLEQEQRLKEQPTTLSFDQGLGLGMRQGFKDVVTGIPQAFEDVAGTMSHSKDPRMAGIGSSLYNREFRATTQDAQAMNELKYQAQTGDSWGSGLGRGIGQAAATSLIPGGNIMNGAAAFGLQPSQMRTTPEEALAQRGEDAMTGAAVGLVAPSLTKMALKGAGKVVEKIGQKAEQAPIMESDTVREMGHQIYNDAAEKGGALKPDYANKYFDEMAKTTQNEHGKATRGTDEISSLNERWQALKDKPITLESAQAMSEGMNDIVDNYVDPVTGKLKKEGQRIYDAQTKFLQHIENAKDDDLIGGKEGFDRWKEGKKVWSAAIKTADIERIIDRAEMMDNPATGIKNGFRTLARSKRMNGYTDTEKEMVRKAARTGILSDPLRTMLGSRLISSMGGYAAG